MMDTDRQADAMKELHRKMKFSWKAIEVFGGYRRALTACKATDRGEGNFNEFSIEARQTALRILGLPADWAFSEEELKAACRNPELNISSAFQATIQPARCVGTPPTRVSRENVSAYASHRGMGNAADHLCRQRSHCNAALNMKGIARAIRLTLTFGILRTIRVQRMLKAAPPEPSFYLTDALRAAQDLLGISHTRNHFGYDLRSSVQDRRIDPVEAWRAMVFIHDFQREPARFSLAQRRAELEPLLERALQDIRDTPIHGPHSHFRETATWLLALPVEMREPLLGRRGRPYRAWLEAAIYDVESRRALVEKLRREMALIEQLQS